MVADFWETTVSGHRPRAYFSFSLSYFPFYPSKEFVFGQFYTSKMPVLERSSHCCICGGRGHRLEKCCWCPDGRQKVVAEELSSGHHLGRRAYWLNVLRVSPTPHGCVHGHIQQKCGNQGALLYVHLAFISLLKLRGQSLHLIRHTVSMATVNPLIFILTAKYGLQTDPCPSA